MLRNGIIIFERMAAITLPAAFAILLTKFKLLLLKEEFYFGNFLAGS
jgi:hypothetical protein